MTKAVHPFSQAAQPRIKEYREKRGLSQRALAEKLGDDVHFTTISKIETGKMALTIEWAARLAHALEIDIFNLLREEGAPEDSSLPVKHLRSGVAWEDIGIATHRPQYPANNDTNFLVRQRDLKGAPQEKLSAMNDAISGVLIRIDTLYTSLINSDYYVFRLRGDYYLGIYRDAPPRFVHPFGWPDHFDFRFGPDAIEVIGWAVERVEALYHEGPEETDSSVA